MTEPTLDALGVPEAFRARCEGCGDVIDVRRDGHAQHVEGWAPIRARGTNTVAAMIRHPRWICRFCLGRLRDGISWDQGTLI